jgi:gamma-glutamyltranspeptidase/glutathione hydrolase
MKAKRLLGWTASLLLGTVILATVAGLTFRVALGPVVQDSAPDAVYAPHGVVATSQPLASQAGLQVLQRGGNAVDAAVTAAAVLNVVEPYMTGLGGDMFAILWSEREQRLVGINGSGRAGALMTRDALGGSVRDTGAKSITIPGALSGWAALLEEYGTITLAEALRPAVVLAEEGFPVSKTTASEWALFADDLKSHPGARDTYLINGERAPQAGEWFSNPDLAKTMQAIANEGPGLLYGGALGQSIAALEMLRLLESYDLASMGHNSVTYLHHLIEAKKLAYADLEHFVGDPEFMAIEPEQLLADDFITMRRTHLSPERALSHATPDRSLTDSETTYLAVADEEGNMISFINSLAGPFGSGVVVPGTGFALQNRAAGFSIKEGRANTVGPGRRPFHTIIPGFVTKTGADGKQEPWLSYGIVGGPQQPQAHVQVLLNMLLFDMDVQQALDAPRFRHWRASSVTFETSIPESTIDDLHSMGHRTQDPLMEVGSIFLVRENMGLIFGGGQGIMRNERGYIAGSDSRRDGLAAAH